MLLRRSRIPRGYVVIEDSCDSKTEGRARYFLWFFALFIVVGSILFFSTQATADTEVGINDGESGQLLFGTQSKKYVRAVHLNTEIDVDINGMVAKVIYRQQFRNDSRDWQEATYVFPLAENAAVNHMEMTIGNRRIVSQIKEREEAKRIYTEAKNSGKRAALTEQQRPNLFTQRVANIAPGEEIFVELHFVQTVSYQHGRFEFHLPTTLTPRYIPGEQTVSIEEEKHYRNQGQGWALPTDEVPDAPEITPPMISVESDDLTNPMKLSVRLNAGLLLNDISSAYHEIQQSRSGNIYQLDLAKGEVSMDRDFRLSWQPVPSQAPEAAVFAEQIDGENYLLLMLVPPQVAVSEQPLPREMIFVMDTSGSMQGTSIIQAKQSLLLALDRLEANDRFNVVEFNSGHRALFPAPVEANLSNVLQAKRFVEALRAKGGTQMQPAIEAALQNDAPESYLKQVVFITDGAVGNEAALFSLIENRLGEARLFTVGIGSAPNSYFMRKAAEFGRGSFTYIGDQSEVQTRMTELFSVLESPVLSDLQIEWPDDTEQYPTRSPDLYASSPLVLSAKIFKMSGQVQISGKTASQDWQRSISLENPSEEIAEGVSTVWGRAKIESLMDEKIRGRNPHEVRDEVIRVALPLKLVSQYTSLVAVEELISRTPEEALKQSAVPNAVAKGQIQQPGTYPQTATWMPLNFLFGSVALGIWLLARRKGLV